MTLRVFLSKVKTRYEDDGLGVLARDGVRYAKNGFRKPRYQADERVDTVDRWEIIRSNLDAKDANLLDIGCADGVLTAKFAEDGLFCVGLERDETNIKTARKEHGSHSGVTYMKHETDPQNIKNLPEFDVILLLTVYEWWCRDYGVEAAGDMLNDIYSKSNKLFFEGHGSEIGKGGPKRETGEDVEQYYTDYFEDVLGSVRVEYLGMTDYKGEERKNPLFVLS